MNIIKDIVKAQKVGMHLCPLFQMVSCQTELRILTARIVNKFKQDFKLGMAKFRLFHNSNAARSFGSCIRCKRHSQERTQCFLQKMLEKESPDTCHPQWHRQHNWWNRILFLAVCFFFIVWHCSLHHCWETSKHMMLSSIRVVTTGQMSGFFPYKTFIGGNMLLCVTRSFHFINQLSIKMLMFHRYFSVIKASQLKNTLKKCWKKIGKNIDHWEVNFCLI